MIVAFLVMAVTYLVLFEGVVENPVLVLDRVVEIPVFVYGVV